jgi:protoporphyrinogen oxidase
MTSAILGAGVTGLATAHASGLPAFEAAETPGGICSSYYVRPGSSRRLPTAPADGEAYRFELGGGHWLFGGDRTAVRFMKRLAPTRSYERRSSVFFHESGLYVPYPLQNHLRYLDGPVAARAVQEMSARDGGDFRSLRDWLLRSFGATLCDLFFFPFHELYTAGLYDRIAPQDAYKSPVDLPTVVRGASSEVPAAGYNATFLYPEDGLDGFARRLAERSDIRYGKRAVRIDAEGKRVDFADGSAFDYEELYSTLPLNRTLELAGLATVEVADPFTSVLVLNIGAVRGERCPDDHWLYNCRTNAGFHRVGFYSNVDRSFLPAVSREKGDRVSIYVERAYLGDTAVAADEVARYTSEVVDELRAWGFIEAVEVADPTWIDVAYTWNWPGSRWRQQALAKLEAVGIHAIGRYGSWQFQGIADSVREGLFVGAAARVD